MENNSTKMIQVAALYKSKSGRSIQGKFGDARLFIIPNSRKKSDRHPDFLVFIAPVDRQQQPAQQQQHEAQSFDEIPY